INTPNSEIKKNSHCIGFTFSLSKKMAKIIVNTGDKYCTVVAIAIGKFCKVIKNKNKPVAPDKPLINNHFLLLPKTGIRFSLTTVKQMDKEIMERKNTSS